MSVKALVPGITSRARRAGIEMPQSDAEMLATEMLELASYDDRMALLDERLSELYDTYNLHLFLTKRPDYRVAING